RSAYRNKTPRNRRPKGDAVTSPAASANGFTSPSLLASKIIVSPRDGTVTTSDDAALSLTPNCHTIVSPLYVCTNQPTPCGSGCPSRPSGARQAAASGSARRGPPFLSAKIG